MRTRFKHQTKSRIRIRERLTKLRVDICVLLIIEMIFIGFSAVYWKAKIAIIQSFFANKYV